MDNLTLKQRSYTMSRIRSKDTAPELRVRRLVHARGLRFRKHCRAIAGCPDLLFVGAKVAVFVDGDFWHGWRFPQWKHKLTSYWRTKIERNRRRDARTFQLLRRQGWIVIRLWEHSINQDAAACIDRIEHAVRRHSVIESAK